MAIHTTGGEANVAQPERAEPARRSAPFSGILFERPELLPVPAPEQPAYFSDLTLIKSSRRSRRGAPSAGLQALSQYLDRYIASPAFTALADETSARLDELAAIRYSIHIHGSRVTVSAVTGDADYSAEVERTFARF